MINVPNPDTPSPQSPAADSDPPLLLDELFVQCMGNVAVARLILDKFETQLRNDIHLFEQCLVTGDATQISRTSHALKGAAGAVGAQALRMLAANLEMLVKQSQLTDVATELDRIRAEADRCVAYLPIARVELGLRNAAQEGDQ